MRPDVRFQWRDIKIPDHDRPCAGAPRCPPMAQFAQKRKFVFKLGIDQRIGNIATRRHVDTVHFDFAQVGTGIDDRENMPRILAFTP